MNGSKFARFLAPIDVKLNLVSEPKAASGYNVLVHGAWKSFT